MFLSLLLPCTIRAANPTAADTATILEDIRRKHDFPGLAVIVIKDGKVCDLAAVGVRKLGDPIRMTTNDLFHIGSCTKSMTATLAAEIVEEGKLRFDSTVSQIFPELRGHMDRQYEAVTLLQLLQHRAGVPEVPPPSAWQRAWEQHGEPRQQRYEFIKAVLALPPQAAPGTKFIYSNQGYAIAGAMLERVAGLPWEQLITDRLFRPLHMDSAGFGPPGTTGKTDQPLGHRKIGEIVSPLQSDNPPAIGPAGTVHCSLTDLAKYAVAHLEGERKGGLLKPESFRLLHTPAAQGDYACGWGVHKRSWAGGIALTHTGSNTLWYLVMWLAPQKDFAVIVATNTGAGDAFKGCDEVAAAMIHAWLN
ncbi:MAG TPA: serine hydrolase domain-containing protein [Verrucomicrobiae bacterium]|nr:serine hydrolase domain-containing protein [Verrucomicrobiae bacterium]